MANIFNRERALCADPPIWRVTLCANPHSRAPSIFIQPAFIRFHGGSSFAAHTTVMIPSSNAVTSVLIVDDEPAVTELMARWVTSLGLQPTTAANADEAIEALRARHHDLA